MALRMHVLYVVRHIALSRIAQRLGCFVRFDERDGEGGAATVVRNPKARVLSEDRVAVHVVQGRVDGNSP